MGERTEMGHQVRNKIIVFVSAAILISGLILGGVFISHFSKSRQEALLENWTRIVNSIAEKSAVGIETGNLPLLSEEVQKLSESKDVLYLLVFDREGELLANTNEQKARLLLGGMIWDASARESVTTVFGDRLDLVAPVRLRGKSQESVGSVRLGISLSEIIKERSDLLKKMAFLLVVLMGGVVWATILFTRDLVEPLERMNDAASRVGRGDFSESEFNQGHGLAPMVSNLRGMIHRVQEGVSQVNALMDGFSESIARIGEGSGNQTQGAKKTLVCLEGMNASFMRVVVRIDELSGIAQTTSPALVQMSAATIQVANSTSNLSSYVEDTASALLEMSSSIRQVVEHINALTDHMSDTTASCSRMNNSINEIETTAKESALLTEKVSRDADELGRGAIEKTIEGMNNIQKAVEKSSSVIYKLGERTEYIGKILTVIDEVTRQTNLLALNAAILAAQAGEHGRGFAVVADEIKSLADRTGSSTKEIAQLIRDLQSEAQDAINSIREGGRSVEEGVRLSLDARGSLSTILEGANRSSLMSRQIEKSTLAQVQVIHSVTLSMDKMNTMVHQVNSAMQEQGKVIEHITEGSEKVRLITRQVKVATEEQAVGSKQTAAAIEEITAGIVQIGQGIGDQKKEAQNLTERITEAHEAVEANKKLSDKLRHAQEELQRTVSSLKSEVDAFKI
ncbi:MAG: methyl-accepting chemotaxis protein [Nitrospirota bacterium]